ncbi:MAG: hypothetical protein AUH28_20595 [Acidobacteria bacterium 13_1_40CM_56_16]|nr:MAG: hypothetical protein AUH28_20595 [Acidobacteria bacterium 13_1_40CM_56_16]
MNRARLCTIEWTRLLPKGGVSRTDPTGVFESRPAVHELFSRLWRSCVLAWPQIHALWWSLALVFRSARARSRFRCDMDLSEAIIPIFIGEDCAGKVGEGLCNCAQLWVLISAHTACLSVNQRLRPELT